VTTAPPLTKPREHYESEVEWLRAQVQILEIWRDDCLQTLLETGHFAGIQQRRIEELETALRKTRNSAWDIYYGSRSVLNAPIEEPDTAPPKPKKKAGS
jgi:hypothetical protein